MSSGLSCGSKCAKYTLFLFNLLFWLAGAVILGVSIWLLVDENAIQFLEIIDIGGTSESLVRASAILLCVVGSIVFLTGFLGCCGAIRESTCMLVTYSVIVIILLLAQITAGILAVVFKNKIMSTLEQSMNTTVQTYYGQPGRDTVTTAWDVMQLEFKCCGVLDPYPEWQTSLWYTSQNVTARYNVPTSCCVTDGLDTPVDYMKCSQAAADPAMTDRDMYYHSDGCYESLEYWVKSHSAILIGIAFGLAATQILALVFACCLQSSINDSRKDKYQA